MVLSFLPKILIFSQLIFKVFILEKKQHQQKSFQKYQQYLGGPPAQLHEPL